MKKLIFFLALLASFQISAQSVDSLKIIPANPGPEDTVYLHVFGEIMMSANHITRIVSEINPNEVTVHSYWKSCGGYAMIFPYDTLFEIGVLPVGNYNFTLMNCADSNTVDSSCHLLSYIYCGDTIPLNFGVIGLEKIDHNETKLTIIPNPINSTAQILFDQSYSNISLELYDIQGRCIIKKSVINCDEVTIDLSGFNDGVYFARVTLDNQQTISRKIIKKH